MPLTKFAYMSVQKKLLNATFKCSLLLLVSNFPYVENYLIKLLITTFTGKFQDQMEKVHAILLVSVQLL